MNSGNNTILLVSTTIGILLLIYGLTIAGRSGGRIGKFFKPVSILAGLAIAAVSIFNGVFFYAEPGYKYHVRTITGAESMVKDVGYNVYLFGRYNSWKNAMSVQSSRSGGGELSAESEGATMSANLPPQSLVFLDQVDALVQATARFELPSDEESFLRLARQYRTPENLLRTELIPAFQETLGANAALMSAENYFQGGKTEFNNEFQRQMENGIYLVRRVEERVRLDEGTGAKGTANVSLGTKQEEYGEQFKTIFKVEKLNDSTGQPLRKDQSFNKFGISVTSARVTHVQPNAKFRERMQLRQQAAADRAIAREKRVQEEEQRLLAIAKGEREVAERQAAAKVEQIEKTTNAETAKQLALTEARRRNEQAIIDRDTSQIQLERARIDAEARQVAADAAAYEKSAILAADNALQQKLDAYVTAQKFWADAFSQRKVPTQVFGGQSGGAGNDSDIQNFMDIMTMRAARDLSLDPAIGRLQTAQPQ